MHIPEDITEHEILELNAVLRAFLRDLGNQRQSLYASCRLNRSGVTDAPVFIAWVETASGVRNRRALGHPHPPSRFGDEHRSRVFTDCCRLPAGRPLNRNWRTDYADHDSLEYGRKWYRETHRKSLAIIVDGNTVGTVNVGFEADPTNTVDNTFRWWAQASQSELVNTIRDILK